MVAYLMGVGRLAMLTQSVEKYFWVNPKENYMSEESKRLITAEDLYSQGVYFNRLSDHLDKNSASVEEVVNYLDEISNLENIRFFEDIGEEADQTRNSLLENYDRRTVFGLAKTQLNDDDQDQLNGAVQRWWTRFTDRVEDKVFPVTTQSDIPSEKLLMGPGAFIDVEVSDRFEDEMEDFQEACVNALVGNHTSAEFMALRGTEGILRKWYEAETDENHEYSDWYSAIEQMTSEQTGSHKNLKLLDYLRDRRNEVAHPDRHSDKRDAENTLRNAFEVAEELITDIQN